MTSAASLALYAVTLPWNPSDSGEGVYSARAWAVDESSAVLKIAMEMAGLRDSGCETEADRLAFVESLIQDDSAYVEPVGKGLLRDMHSLLSGADGVMSPSALAHYTAISEILAVYVRD